MSDLENKNTKTVSDESVDDILAGILNADGTFNEEFNGLLKKYVEGDSPVVVVSSDISDRRDEPAVSSRIEYEEKQDALFETEEKTINERIEDKIPEIARDLYLKASEEAQRPEFTSTGDVKYPAMGVGESEERVVFDADWEETAKKEAARLERVRQDRMLRGDSAYARTFAPAGTYMPRRTPYVDAPEVNASYIDPVSDDDDFGNIAANLQYYSSSKKSFFPEGFSVTQRNSSASDGKTERVRSGSSAYYRKETALKRTDVSWLQVEEKPEKKKKNIFRKKNNSARKQEADVREDEQLLQGTPDTAAAQTAENSQKYDEERSAQLAMEMNVAEKEAEGLRSTVAEIVDKYNKRSEEEERKRLAEQARLEEQRREEELRERRRLEEIRGLKDQMSPEVFRVAEKSDSEDDLEEFDDFSTEPADKTGAGSKKTFSVIFDPGALKEDKEAGKRFTERISPEKIESMLSEDDISAERGRPASARKKTDRKNRRKEV